MKTNDYSLKGIRKVSDEYNSNYRKKEREAKRVARVKKYQDTDIENLKTKKKHL